jgi:hypothetical protein
MIPKKPAPDLIRGGNRFSEEIMRNRLNRRLFRRPVGIVGLRQGGDRLGDLADSLLRRLGADGDCFGGVMEIQLAYIV